MLPSAVRDGLVTRLQTIAGLRCYDTLPDAVTPPCAVIGNLDLTFDIDNARGLDQANLDILVIVQRMSERAGQNKLDAFLAGTGAGSIKTAIEGDRTLGGAVQTLRVLSASPGEYESAGTLFLAYRYRLTIYG